jgi:hypothetical protein
LSLKMWWLSIYFVSSFKIILLYFLKLI